MIEEIRHLFPGVGKKLIEVNVLLPINKGFLQDALYQLFLVTLES